MDLRSDQSNGLWFYQLFNRLGWPHSYFGKVFLVAFIATHFPLLAFIAYFFFDLKNAANKIILLLLLLATLAGTLLFFWAWQQLLKPMLLAKQALAAYLVRAQIIELPTAFDDEVGLLLNCVDDTIQRFERSQQQLEQITAEVLTGLPNRHAADRQLQQSLSLAERHKLPLGIALLGVDNFQHVNDRYGHAVGEQVLVQLAEHLQDNLRGGDSLVCWGGEKFLVVIFTDIDGTRIALERIRSTVANFNLTVANAEIQLTVSIGFTMARGAEKPQACLERAEVALSSAKQAGRNRVEFFTTFI